MEPAITHSEGGKATLHRITFTSLKALCRAAQVSPKHFQYQDREFLLVYRSHQGYTLSRRDKSLFGTYWNVTCSGTSMDKLIHQIKKAEESGWLLKSPASTPAEGDDLIQYEEYDSNDPDTSRSLQGELVILNPKFMNAPLQERIFSVVQEPESSYVEGFFPAEDFQENQLVFQYWIEAVITNKAEVLEMLHQKQQAH